MKSILAVLLILFTISGCSSSDNDEMKNMKWFKTEEEAINYGIKEEGINKENIMGKIEQNHEIFVFFKEEEKEGIAVNIANVIKRDKQYAWDGIQVSWLIDNPSPEVSIEFETQSKKKFTVYSGTTTNKKISIETKSGQKVEPEVDKDSGIYFYIESSK